jgi:hypothetical protein
MRDELGLIDWQRELGNENADKAWDKFRDLLESSIEKHVPIAEIKDNGRPKWLSREIVKLIRKKKAWKQYRLYGTDDLANRYEELQREVKKKSENQKENGEKT